MKTGSDYPYSCGGVGRILNVGSNIHRRQMGIKGLPDVHQTTDYSTSLDFQHDLFGYFVVPISNKTVLKVRFALATSTVLDG